MSSESGTPHQELDPLRLPAHVAIIMDGNGRWAKKRLLNRVKGHERGTQTVRSIVRATRNLDIPVLTLYAFSTENWQRPKMEVQALMSILERFLKSEENEMMETGIRLNTIGETDRLPGKVRDKLLGVMSRTRSNDRMLLNLALSYGSRTEIVQMARALAAKVQDGTLAPDDITEQTIADHLYTRSMPDPDLLIRTSGEMRISNFLLWQIAYSEIHITHTLWPDFTPDEYYEILAEYQRRDRRFGKIPS